MTRYLMTLKPLDTFFFGQENKYRKRDKKIEADYYQKSAYFPQQTTILGMLRYYLLLKNEQIPIQTTHAATLLVGEESFKPSGKNLTFGAIQSISPVFIAKEEKKYIPQPLDVLLKEGKIQNIRYEKVNVKSNFPNNKDQLFYFKDYDEKMGLSNFLVNISDPADYILYEGNGKAKGIFIPEERTGITKGRDGQTDESAFYKQVVYKMKNAAFACIIEMDDGYIEDGHSGLVPMGAEKSLFKIGFKKIAGNLEDLVELKMYNAPKLVLLSDAYIPDEVNMLHRFSISQTKAFRFLESVTDKKANYDNFEFETGKKSNGVRRSDRFNLFKRGSVFYFDDNKKMDQMKVALKNQHNFYKIGYNHYIEIQKN